MSCVRVQQYGTSKIGNAERHIERLNSDYSNLNVIQTRSGLNIHYKDPDGKSYMEILREKEKAGHISLRGLRQDATLFDEIVIDVNTMYFEKNGGYQYAKQFYEDAYLFLQHKFGKDNIISCVMHADELNIAVTEELEKNVFHYHMHAVVIPVVEKQIVWSKRCKNPELIGKTKKIINQVSHSKKWASNIIEKDSYGNTVYRKNGKPKYKPSYSILQDEFYNYMRERGYTDFERGKRGSTVEHLSSVQYQIKKDIERLDQIQFTLEKAEKKYEPAINLISKAEEIDNMGKKSITGKINITNENMIDLKALAKEAIQSRREIAELKETIDDYKYKTITMESNLKEAKQEYKVLESKCKPFITALKYFPELVTSFIQAVKEKLLERTNKIKESIFGPLYSSEKKRDDTERS